ncbi:hypothetical protein FB480_101221 [Agrobacterium vitis]|nr:hypothetical protein FB480_101221 [Agrobacterium vitis]
MMTDFCPDLPDIPAGADPVVSKIAYDLYHLHYDVAVLAWGCDRLWQHEFSGEKDNEFLSHFPLAALRMLSLQMGQMRSQTDALLNGATK